jgi:hypothetical protein
MEHHRRFGDFLVRTPIPEAYFVQKLLTAQRRPGEGQKDRDLEQCSVISSRLDPDRLARVVDSLKLGPKSRKSLRLSCEAIGFPPQKLGLR